MFLINIFLDSVHSFSHILTDNQILINYLLLLEAVQITKVVAKNCRLFLNFGGGCG